MNGQHAVQLAVIVYGVVGVSGKVLLYHTMMIIFSILSSHVLYHHVNLMK
ncbi:unnamed protein product [Brugia pahangi]|uniref:7TM_GPCR_Srx domain-containing protein n=1 Tax=Brugia pahangi TaxID=6280 RepID=A0A0N4TCV5_BRUPA|nr:unnamed protein product [Brugia pahangi]